MTLTDLETRAGVTDRAAFWLPYSEHRDGFDLAIDELRRRAGLPALKRNLPAPITGHNLARLQARQNRSLLAIVLFGMLMALFMGLLLAPIGLHRQAAFHFAEARV
ncbi:MAG TPA: hypothetical protein VL202_00360 [Pararhizobium sp.]|uniref:hypothetical protein n=1 Tax=Pararhizobium sp. TaxID=1977563 RepID=UPI002C3F64D7|nr:hypothetical protein [Pararhizobium sp.]HTO29622.1 hypothetical protein [Pararhizobium sp.]